MRSSYDTVPLESSFHEFAAIALNAAPTPLLTSTIESLPTSSVSSSVYRRLTGYQDVNDAERLTQDPTLHLIGSEKTWEGAPALTRSKVAVPVHNSHRCSEIVLDSSGFPKSASRLLTGIQVSFFTFALLLLTAISPRDSLCRPLNLFTFI